MKHFSWTLLGLYWIGLTTAWCRFDRPIPYATQHSQTVAQANNTFAFDLYARVHNTNGNVFYSPSSLSTALAMTYGGARGTTAQEMAKVLHFSLAPEQLHPAMAQWSQQLITPSKAGNYQLSLANAIWLQSGAPFEQAYLDTMQKYYGTSLQLVNFKTQFEQARLSINAWVAERTEKKILNLIKPGMLSDETRLVLTNALYFLSDWADPFEKNATYPQDFHLQDGQKMKVDMMHQTQPMQYMETSDVQVLEKDYKGNDLSMVFILPKKKGALSQLSATWNNTVYEQWVSKLQTRKVEVCLPKFTFNTEYEMSKVLAAMGMPLAFSDQADFSGISRSMPLTISHVVHQAFVRVDEKGTEAAAATAVIMKEVSAFVEPPLVFNADHPFMVILRDKRSGSILFMGCVKEPAASQGK